MLLKLKLPGSISAVVHICQFASEKEYERDSEIDCFSEWFRTGS